MTATTQSHAYNYLTQAEARFLDAAVARLIPADDLGPGAKEAGVTLFIDRQLLSAWGTHGRNYRTGPWPEGTPQQGFQSRLTPQEIYRAAIRESDLHCVKQHGKVFAFLTSAQQDDVLRGLEAGKIELDSVSSKLFFDLLWRNADEGFFADPLYGGNHDMAGWKLIGYPGVAPGDYPAQIEKHNEPYHAEPVSIVDVAEGRAPLDSQGHPKHVRRTGKAGSR